MSSAAAACRVACSLPLAGPTNAHFVPQICEGVPSSGRRQRWHSSVRAQRKRTARGWRRAASCARSGGSGCTGLTVMAQAMEDAAAQAMLNANAGGASKAAALKAHGAMMAAAAPASEAPANEKI